MPRFLPHGGRGMTPKGRGVIRPHHAGRWAAGLLAVVGVVLPSCAKAEPSATTKTEPYTLEPIEGGVANRLVLEAKAAERLGLETATVDALPEAAGTSIPYAALLYDPDGTTSVYTNPDRLVYVRRAITVEYIQGDRVVLREGPPKGTPVVTTGGAELTGIEFGVGK